MKLIIIRPQPGADATAAMALKMGLSPLVTPCFSVQPLPWTAENPAQYDALFITSANAVRHGGAQLEKMNGLPVYAVGAASAEMAKEAGFTVKSVGDGGAGALAKMAAERGDKKLLWLAGENRSQLDAMDDIHIDAKTVYASRRLPVPDNLLSALDRPVCVALHSARAARYFAEICDQKNANRAHIYIAAISANAAKAAGNGWAKIAIADTPDDGAILSKAKSFFTSIGTAP